MFDFDGGGLESVVADMAAAYQGSSIEVSLVTLSGRMGQLGELTRNRFHDFKVARPLPLASMALPIGLARTIVQTKPEIVHLHTGAWFKGVRAARLAGIRRTVYTEHGREHWDPPLMRVLDAHAARYTQAVVAVSSRLATYLARRLGIEPAKIHTIHNGVDTTRFTPGAPSSELRRALNIETDVVVLGSVGRLEAVKGYDTLLDAAAILRGQVDQRFALVLFGEGSQRGMLEARARRLGIDAFVRFAGWTQRPVDAYRAMNVFVLSSRSEGQSVSLLEAMACGVTPVVTDVGANAETLGAELRANVVPSNNPAALANALSAALRPMPSARRAGAGARCRVTELYSRQRMLQSYEDLYRGRSSTTLFAPTPTLAGEIPCRTSVPNVHSTTLSSPANPTTSTSPSDMMSCTRLPFRRPPKA